MKAVAAGTAAVGVVFAHDCVAAIESSWLWAVWTWAWNCALTDWARLSGTESVTSRQPNTGSGA